MRFSILFGISLVALSACSQQDSFHASALDTSGENTSSTSSTSSNTAQSSTSLSSQRSRCSIDLDSVAAQTPVPIRSEADLLEVQSGKNYALANDLVLSSRFTPVDLISAIFDGKGFAVNGLSLDLTTNAGLFASVQCSRVRNLTINQPQVRSLQVAGGLAARIRNSLIEKVHIEGGSVGGRTAVGGAIGGLIGIVGPGNDTVNGSDDSAVRSCSSSALVHYSGDGSYMFQMGGLIGMQIGGITARSYSTGRVVLDTAVCKSMMPLQIGGLVGFADTQALIGYSYASGDVDCGSGLVGSLDRSSVILRSFATGSASYSGLVAFGPSPRGSMVLDSYAAPSVGRDPLPLVVGWASDFFISRAFGVAHNAWSGELWNANAKQIVTTNDLKRAETYASWDTTNVWRVASGSLPQLKWQSDAVMGSDLTKTCIYQQPSATSFPLVSSQAKLYVATALYGATRPLSPQNQLPGCLAQSDVTVNVGSSASSVVLALQAFAPVQWKIVNPNNVRIERIVFLGLESQSVSGVDASVPVQHLEFRVTKNNEGNFLDTDGSLLSNNMLNRLYSLFGRSPVSSQYSEQTASFSVN